MRWAHKDECVCMCIIERLDAEWDRIPPYFSSLTHHTGLYGHNWRGVRGFQYVIIDTSSPKIHQLPHPSKGVLLPAIITSHVIFARIISIASWLKIIGTNVTLTPVVSLERNSICKPRYCYKVVFHARHGLWGLTVRSYHNMPSANFSRETRNQEVGLA